MVSKIIVGLCLPSVRIAYSPPKNKEFQLKKCPKCGRLTDANDGGLCLNCFLEKRNLKVDKEKIKKQIETAFVNNSDQLK